MDKKEVSGAGVVSIILGCIGLLLSCLTLGIIFLVPGLILGIKGFKNERTNHATCTAGVIICLIGLAICLFTGFIACITTDSSENETEQIEETIIVEETEKEVATPMPTAEPTIEPTAEPTPTIDPSVVEEEYKAECQEFNYKDVLRNPENFIGQKVKIQVEVSTVHSEGLLTPVKYYFCYSEDEPGSGYYWGNKYAIFDLRKEGDFKILEEDVIMVWGEISEPQETTSLIVNSEELFCIDMKYAELISE